MGTKGVTKKRKISNKKCSNSGGREGAREKQMTAHWWKNPERQGAKQGSEIHRKRTLPKALPT